MEASSCIKAVIFAATQYYNCKTDSTLVHLQRQLDVLIGITGRNANIRCFLPPQLAATECLTCIVDVLSDPTTMPQLSLKCILLLTNLVHNPKIRWNLYKKFNLIPALAGLLKIQGNNSSDSLVLKCVQLLQEVTYGHYVDFKENYMEDLLKYLVKQILASENTLTQSSLGLLANLCRNNYSNQSFINNLEDAKKLKLKLIPLLSHNNLSVIVFSLSILTSLCLHEELGQKLFNANNINQTFKMMFNIVINGESGTSRMYVIDLFTDLMKSPKIQHLLSEFPHFAASIKELFTLLLGCSSSTATKVFVLLISFCSVSRVRQTVANFVFGLASSNDVTVTLPNKSCEATSNIQTIINWVSSSLDSEDEVGNKALQFGCEMFEELHVNAQLSTQQSFIDPVLAVVNSCLKNPPPVANPDSMKLHCCKQVLAIRLLAHVCQDSGLLEKVLTGIDVEHFNHLLQFQFNNNSLSINCTKAEEAEDWSLVGVELVLFTLNLLSTIQSDTIKSFFVETLQDARVVPFLSLGLRSSCRDKVHAAINLVAMGSNLQNFPSLALGDVLAAGNAYRDSSQQQTLHTPTGNNEQSDISGNSSAVLPHQSSTKLSSINDQCIEDLIEKMQTGLEVKDMKLSEMIDIYEHKLQSMQVREQQLQDLLEAKTLAVNRADRVISQYRSRRAEVEAENCSMRHMVRDFERRTEDYQAKLKDMESLQTDYNQLLIEKQKLMGLVEEYQQLKENYAEQCQKTENLEHMLNSLKEEHASLEEMHEILRRHHESLKQQNEIALEKQAKLSRSLKEFESQVKVLKKLSCEQEEQLHKISKERDELEEAIDKVRGNLSKTEADKKELYQQISSLELVCQQHESSIQEKTTELQRVKEELDKHTQIAALIHNLSSGKAPPPGKVFMNDNIQS